MLEFHDFLGCVWSGCGGHKTDGDDLSAEPGEYVQGGGFGFGPEPRRGGATLGGAVLVVAVEGVSGDEDVAEQSERGGSFHGFRDTVACLPGAEEVVDIDEHHLDRIAGRVAGDDVLGCGGEVGGDQCDVIPAGGAGFGGFPVLPTGRTCTVRQVPNQSHTRSVVFTVPVVL
ncbi:MAG TPA: hypothetical protein VJT49_22405 [Amycolatopsis sp.]|uniref:hypothetical protein n=1 Tax=Amycolatopsis sp. TaxID=37632 RepID=UPI002B45C787|nr:hypothetical protein [Amycolatopsis sp.]HKS47813.1 hypothetical protein [Amycolatopsis sp.]